MVGPFADNIEQLFGDYTSEIQKSYTKTPLKGLAGESVKMCKVELALSDLGVVDLYMVPRGKKEKKRTLQNTSN